MKSIPFSFIVLIVSSILILSVHKTYAQSCNTLEGEWVNELGSVLVIDSISEHGEMLGVYKSSTGVDGKQFPLKGWVNVLSDYPGELNISFSVRWADYGSITSWTGYCYELNKEVQIKTIWHLVRSGKEFDWERIISNSSVFKPMSAN